MKKMVFMLIFLTHIAHAQTTIFSGVCAHEPFLSVVSGGSITIPCSLYDVYESYDCGTATIVAWYQYGNGEKFSGYEQVSLGGDGTYHFNLTFEPPQSLGVYSYRISFDLDGCGTFVPTTTYTEHFSVDVVADVIDPPEDDCKESNVTLIDHDIDNYGPDHDDYLCLDEDFDIEFRIFNQNQDNDCDYYVTDVRIYPDEGDADIDCDDNKISDEFKLSDDDKDWTDEFDCVAETLGTAVFKVKLYTEYHGTNTLDQSISLPVYDCNCVDECSVGAVGCHGDVPWQCLQFGLCLIEYEVSSCAYGCENGGCKSKPCENECYYVGEVGCDGDVAWVCQKTGDCYKKTVEQCSDYCSSGVCKSCNHECSADTSGCAVTAFGGESSWTCGEDVNGCRVKDYQSCEAIGADYCSGDVCKVCNHDCVVGASGCEGDNDQRWHCASNSQGCRYKKFVTCSDYCSSGVCKSCNHECSADTSGCAVTAFGGESSWTCGEDVNGCRVKDYQSCEAIGADYCSGDMCAICTHECSADTSGCAVTAVGGESSWTCGEDVHGCRVKDYQSCKAIGADFCWMDQCYSCEHQCEVSDEPNCSTTLFGDVLVSCIVDSFGCRVRHVKHCEFSGFDTCIDGECVHCEHECESGFFACNDMGFWEQGVSCQSDENGCNKLVYDGCFSMTGTYCDAGVCVEAQCHILDVYWATNYAIDQDIVQLVIEAEGDCDDVVVEVVIKDQNLLWIDKAVFTEYVQLNGEITVMNWRAQYVHDREWLKFLQSCTGFGCLHLPDFRAWISGPGFSTSSSPFHLLRVRPYYLHMTYDEYVDYVQLQIAETVADELTTELWACMAGEGTITQRCTELFELARVQPDVFDSYHAGERLDQWFNHGWKWWDVGYWFVGVVSCSSCFSPLSQVSALFELGPTNSVKNSLLDYMNGAVWDADFEYSPFAMMGDGACELCAQIAWETFDNPQLGIGTIISGILRAGIKVIGTKIGGELVSYTLDDVGRGARAVFTTDVDDTVYAYLLHEVDEVGGVLMQEVSYVNPVWIDVGGSEFVVFNALSGGRIFGVESLDEISRKIFTSLFEDEAFPAIVENIELLASQVGKQYLDNLVFTVHPSEKIQATYVSNELGLSELRLSMGALMQFETSVSQRSFTLAMVEHEFGHLLQTGALDSAGVSIQTTPLRSWPIEYANEMFMMQNSVDSVRYGIVLMDKVSHDIALHVDDIVTYYRFAVLQQADDMYRYRMYYYWLLADDVGRQKLALELIQQMGEGEIGLLEFSTSLFAEKVAYFNQQLTSPVKSHVWKEIVLNNKLNYFGPSK